MVGRAWDADAEAVQRHGRRLDALPPSPARCTHAGVGSERAAMAVDGWGH